MAYARIFKMAASIFATAASLLLFTTILGLAAPMASVTTRDAPDGITCYVYAGLNPPLAGSNSTTYYAQVALLDSTMNKMNEFLASVPVGPQSYSFGPQYQGYQEPGDGANLLWTFVAGSGTPFDIDFQFMDQSGDASTFKFSEMPQPEDLVPLGLNDKRQEFPCSMFRNAAWAQQLNELIRSLVGSVPGIPVPKVSSSAAPVVSPSTPAA